MTYMVDEFSDHPVPLPLVILGAVLAVSYQPDFIREAQDVGELLEKIQAVTLEAVVPTQLLVRLPVHHVWILLKDIIFGCCCGWCTSTTPPPTPGCPLFNLLPHQDGGDNKSPVSQRVSHVVILVSVGLRQVHAFV